MATKKYVSLSKLSTFLDNLKTTFAALSHTHTISELTDYEVDAQLSSTSTNPVQNKIVSTEIDTINQTLSDVNQTISEHETSLGSKVDSTAFTDHVQSPSKGGTGITAIGSGNFLVTNGDESMVEMTPDEVLDYINGANVMTMTTAEYEALGENINANTLYALTDAEEEYASLDDFENLQSEVGNTVKFVSQTLTDNQKIQARENIDAIGNEYATEQFSAIQDSINSIEETHAKDTSDLQTAISDAVTNMENSVAQKSRVQIVTWGVDD